MSQLIDHSGIIAATAKPQEILPPNKSRKGWLFQNRSPRSVYINDDGLASVEPGSYEVAPEAFFPPLGYPVTLGAVSLCGNQGLGFTVKEW
jgi:hypothetical protein